VRLTISHAVLPLFRHPELDGTPTP
jgi:hypothetical protein